MTVSDLCPILKCLPSFSCLFLLCINKKCTREQFVVLHAQQLNAAHVCSLNSYTHSTYSILLLGKTRYIRFRFRTWCRDTSHGSQTCTSGNAACVFWYEMRNHILGKYRFFIFFCLNIYFFHWKGRCTCRWRVRSSICYFIPQVDPWEELRWHNPMSQELFRVSLMGTGCQGFGLLSTDFPGDNKGTGREVEQPEYELVPVCYSGGCRATIYPRGYLAEP